MIARAMAVGAKLALVGVLCVVVVFVAVGKLTTREPEPRERGR